MATAAPVLSPTVHEKLNKSPGAIGIALFGLALVVGFGYAAMHLVSDLSNVHPDSLFPFVLLGAALLIGAILVVRVW